MTWFVFSSFFSFILYGWGASYCFEVHRAYAHQVTLGRCCLLTSGISGDKRNEDPSFYLLLPRVFIKNNVFLTPSGRHARHWWALRDMCYSYLTVCKYLMRSSWPIKMPRAEDHKQIHLWVSFCFFYGLLLYERNIFSFALICFKDSLQFPFKTVIDN